MAKHHNRTSVRTREEIPQMRPHKGGVAIMCPYCTPAHNLVPGQIAVCGTILKLTAVQSVIPARLARIEKLVCIKCHRPAGYTDMVPWQNGFIHVGDCDPETKIFTAPPKLSKWAQFFYGAPKIFTQFLPGTPQPVKEITPDGAETGKVLGYTFYRGT